MCGLCGALGGDFHWTSSLAKAGDDPLEHRRQRRQRIDMVRTLLAPHRIRLDDFHNRSLTLSSPTGAVSIVNDLAELWRAVDEMLSGRELDPLDPDLLQRLTSQQGEHVNG